MGVDGMDMTKMPPELVQKMRETLAVGLAKNFINQVIEELQPKVSEAESPLVKSKNAC
jgi:effector-binding domain-containing protein